MNRLKRNVIAAALGLAASSVACAQSMDKAQYQSAMDVIAADYAVAKEKCDGFAGEAKTNCMNSAKARFGKS